MSVKQVSPAGARRAVLTLLTGVCLVTVLGGSTSTVDGSTRRVRQANDLWLVPADADTSPTPTTTPVLAQAVADISGGRADRAISVFSGLTTEPALGGYALLYLGRANAALGKWEEASAAAKQLLAREPGGYLGDAALSLSADIAESTGNTAAAIEALRSLTASTPLAPERAWLRLGRAADRTGDRNLAALAYWKVYYDSPLSGEADELRLLMPKVPLPAGRTSEDRRQLELRRAELLFGAKRFTDARRAFEALRTGSQADERAHIQLRMAQCDLGLRRYQTAREALRLIAAEPTPLQGEAELSLATALRESGRNDDYVAFVRKFASSTADPSLIEEALNDLGTFLVLEDDDEAAEAVFADMFQRFPNGTFAERAAWRSGWSAYRAGRTADAIRIFDQAVATLGRVDRRPSYLYWSARAHAQRSERETAAAGFRQVIADYRNSYYGRLAQRDLDALGLPAPAVSGPSDNAADDRDAPIVTGGTPPANGETIRRLLAVGLYDAALGELRKVQLETGSSPIVEATIAYVLNRKGELRPAITAMRRAYPQFMADGGEALPAAMLAIIFPLTYWDDICQGATERSLDPYLMAALIAQESTFDARVKSSANAYGLMQILPSTGRRYAPRLGIKPFATSRLTDPGTNILIGMAYFSDLVRRFNGEVAHALAAYNAGDGRVVRWMDERGSIDRDEFVDDIPFPETQNYVKRILGTAEDYRALYRLKLRSPEAEIK